MNKLWLLIKNRDFILCLGLAGGLFAGQWAGHTRVLTLPALALVMTLSTLAITSSHLKNPGRMAKNALAGILMNYLLLSGFILLLTMVAPLSQSMKDGFVVLAIVPPAVAIIPFSEFLDADRPFSLLALLGSYLGALVVMPLMALAYWGPGFVSPLKLLAIMTELIVIPVVLSRVVLALNWHDKIAPYKGAVTNWCFFLVVYNIVGLNRHFLLSNPIKVLPVALIAAASTFGLGMVIVLLCRWRKTRSDLTWSLVLLGTLKNYGLAGGLALAIFDTDTALPAVVSTTFMIIYIIWLNFLKRWVRPLVKTTA